MIIIGIDPHQHSHTAVAVDQHWQPAGQLTILAGPQATAGLLAWAGRWPSAAGRWRAPAGWATTSPSS
jgi:transposase